jgi:hypothetical protein
VPLTPAAIGLLCRLADLLLPSSGILTALTALAAAATLALLAAHLAAHLTGTLATARLLGPAAPHSVRDRALRRRAWQIAFLEQRDPGARGRARPRAPSAAPAAA